MTNMTTCGTCFRKLARFIACVTLVSGAAMAQQVSTDVALHLENSNPDPKGVRDLKFGTMANATIGIDDGTEETSDLGEVKLPPMPPSDVFEARFIPDPDGERLPLAGTEGSAIDYRPLISATQKDTFQLKVQPGKQGSTIFFPVRITWDKDYVKAHYTSATIAGGDLNVNMNESGELTVTRNSQTTLLIITEGPKDPALGVDEVTTDEAFALESLPNPSTGTTTIRYSLPHAVDVTLIVVDINGREVARLVDNIHLPTGEHAVAFNAGNLPGGSYFYTLRAGDVIVTRRMVRGW